MKTHRMVKMLSVALFISLLGMEHIWANEDEAKEKAGKAEQPREKEDRKLWTREGGLYISLQAYPIYAEDLPKGFSSPKPLPDESTPTDRAAQQLVGKVRVALQGSGEETILGYQVYYNYEAARRALAAMSVATDFGITTSIKSFRLTVQSPEQGTELVLRCEGFKNPRLPDTVSARCAALHPHLPVIVTGLSTCKGSEDFVSLTQVITHGLSRPECLT